MKKLLVLLSFLGILGGLHFSACSHEQVKTVDQEQIRGHADEGMQELQEEESKNHKE